MRANSDSNFAIHDGAGQLKDVHHDKDIVSVNHE